MKFIEWNDFSKGNWVDSIDIRDYIQKNYLPYTGDASFLSKPTKRTIALNRKLQYLCAEERKKNGVLSIDTETVSSLLNYKAGYIDKENEIIVGLQTDSPLKRGINPFGGLRMVESACESYGYKMSENILTEFRYRTTHNDGVFRIYSDEMLKARKTGIITGLPDAYGRGRIIGDYRRVALYGVDELIKFKLSDKHSISQKLMDVENIRLSEELYQQIDFLKKLKDMALLYEIDISRPASNAKEAVQWLYFAYLGSIKEQNGAAMSLGRVSTFLDIYFERDIKKGILDETSAQEIIDDFVIKLRMARHLRTPEYNQLFGGDPMWITESIGGTGNDGRTLVTRTSFRFLNTLYTLGSSPEPNLTILWSKDLPPGFKEFCAKLSIDTDSIQYENDDLMRPIYDDDYGIACCVSAMKIGRQMQYFGARCNLPKLLLLSLNGGRDEKTEIQVGPLGAVYSEEYLDYNLVLEKLDSYMQWLCRLYVNFLNVIHYMHDKYAYEKTQMALHDTDIERFMAFGVAGLSVIVDSLSAIKFAKVRVIKGENGLIEDYEIVGDFPKYGNDDDNVDNIAVEIIRKFYNELLKTPTYRGAIHTLSVLTITSNVVYGKITGATPDGRLSGAPFAPGANPMHNRESSGALASLNSISKIPFDCCRDGISCTFSIVPDALGNENTSRTQNLISIIDGYFKNNAHHININVLNKIQLIDAMENPEKYPNLTIRVSGYAVNFHKLTKAQQLEVISRTFHERM